MKNQLTILQINNFRNLKGSILMTEEIEENQLGTEKGETDSTKGEMRRVEIGQGKDSKSET